MQYLQEQHTTTALSRNNVCGSTVQLFGFVRLSQSILIYFLKKVNHAALNSERHSYIYTNR